MTDHFIKLNCGNCGGELDVYDDMERFACGHCGTEIAVQRRGGTIVLKSMTQAIKNTATGADKTSSELALMRLKEEAENLSKRYDAMLKEKIERNKRGYLMGVSVLLIGFVQSGGTKTVRRKQPAGHSTTSTQPGAEKKAAFGISRRYHENDAVVFK